MQLPSELLEWRSLFRGPGLGREERPSLIPQAPKCRLHTRFPPPPMALKTVLSAPVPWARLSAAGCREAPSSYWTKQRVHLLITVAELQDTPELRADSARRLPPTGRLNSEVWTPRKERRVCRMMGCGL